MCSLFSWSRNIIWKRRIKEQYILLASSDCARRNQNVPNKQRIFLPVACFRLIKMKAAKHILSERHMGVMNQEIKVRLVTSPSLGLAQFFLADQVTRRKRYIFPSGYLSPRFVPVGTNFWFIPLTGLGDNHEQSGDLLK